MSLSSNDEVKEESKEQQEQRPLDDSLQQQQEPAQVAIVGAGIVGLVLALALHEKLGIKPELYEKIGGFHPDVGAGMGMYPNGLRVIRDISPELLENVRSAGYPYLYRRWERHDGTEVAVAQEEVLCREDATLQSIGIRRWKLQQVLYEAVQAAGIPIHFNKGIQNVQQLNESNKQTLVKLTFEDGTTCLTEILFAADGSKSRVRELMTKNTSKLEYTGVTCVMGMASSNPSERGICFPSALTTKCHGCFFPTSSEQQCFQMHFPLETQQADSGNWGTLSEAVGQEECRKLSEQMNQDGWHEKYRTPVHHVSNAVRIGFCTLNPPLNKWVYGGVKGRERIVLLGDAAHPPVPYTGQGAQMGLEDAGTLAMLLQKLGLDDNGDLDMNRFHNVTRLYEQIRIPRTLEINTISKSWGHMQQKRADREMYNRVKEEKIKRDVFFHETLPILIPGSTYNYKDAVEEVLQKEPAHLPVVQE